MKANCWMAPLEVSVQEVPDPTIRNRRDAIIRVTSTAICGSDLHLYDGYVPTMVPGDILGHEFMGEVVELGSGVANLAVGDRVVVPFPIACGDCWQCRRGWHSICENSNPNSGLAEKLWGRSAAGIFGYSHATGGFAGGQAEYVRVPFADVGAFKVDADLTDEQVLFLTDIFPTGYEGAELCDISHGDVVAVWGAGPVGYFAAASAFLLGAERVIVIDRFDYRLDIVAKATGAEVLNYEGTDIPDVLTDMTGGRGPDACIDAVGMEAHHSSLPVHAYDKAKQALRLETERPHALREAIMSVRNGGVVSVPGVYGGFLDKFPMGSVVNRSLTVKSFQCHVHRYLPRLYEHIRNGDVDPTAIITHRAPLADAPRLYETFKQKEDDCMKVVLTP